jgi:uncharacterized tellurite resistance protein B-like protein
MLDAIQRFFQQRLEIAPETPDAADRLPVATCALLLEVAHADDTFTAAERDAVRSRLVDHFGLSADEADTLVHLAEQERRESHDLYQFARLINERYRRGEKLAVLRALWDVVYSDGRLEAHEDALMHKLAHLMRLRHDELIAVKLQARRAREAPSPDDP